MVGMKRGGGGAGEAVLGAIAVGLGGGGDFGVEAAEGAERGAADAAQRLGDERYHLVAFGDGMATASIGVGAVTSLHLT